MPGLYVKCKKCGTDFFSGVAVDRKSLETMKLNNLCTCPKCGASLPYRKEDHFFRQ